jgi:hypothetical protein
VLSNRRLLLFLLVLRLETTTTATGVTATAIATTATTTAALSPFRLENGACIHINVYAYQCGRDNDSGSGHVRGSGNDSGSCSDSGNGCVSGSVSISARAGAGAAGLLVVAGGPHFITLGVDRLYTCAGGPLLNHDRASSAFHFVVLLENRD